MTLRDRSARAVHPIGALLLAASQPPRQPPRTRTLMAAWRLNLKFPEPATPQLTDPDPQTTRGGTGSDLASPERRSVVIDVSGVRRGAVLGGALTVADPTPIR